MGYIVVCEDKEIWNPSLTLGNIFFQQVKSLEEIIGESSGIVNSFDDELDIDKDLFKNFTEKCINYFQKSDNKMLEELLIGCVAICIYLYYLIANTWLENPENMIHLQKMAKQFAGM